MSYESKESVGFIAVILWATWGAVAIIVFLSSFVLDHGY